MFEEYIDGTLDKLESGDITALCRANDDDHYFNDLIFMNGHLSDGG